MDESQFVASLRFCSHCNKPFTEDLTYNRHVSYCSRSKNRHRRPKSCRACSLAKTKCSFHSRCTRCVAKGLDCVYERTPTVRRGNSPIPDASLSCHFWLDNGVESRDVFRFDDDALITDLASDAVLPGLELSEASDITSGSSSLFSIATQPSLMPMSTNNLALEVASCHPLDTPDSNFTSGNTAFGLLARLPATEPVIRHSAALITQALRAFPQMMLRKTTFPPFMHSYCHSNSISRAIARCMSISHIFQSSDMETRPFLWESVHQEQQRFRNEIAHMSKQDVLAAVQAQLIYIIMRVFAEDEHKTAEYSLQMLVTFRILCDRFMELCGGPFCSPEEQSPRSTWEDWVFAESRRRTACVWFLMSRVAYVETGIRCDTTESFQTLPLVTTKTLWEARTREEWEAEYEGCGVITHGMRMENFGNLIESNKRWKEITHARRLDGWNAQTDKLGSLLNAAVHII